MNKLETDRVAGRAWLTLAVLVAMLVLSYMDRGLIGLLVGPVRQSLGISEVQISLLYGMAFGLFYAVFAFPLGWLADRWSRRKVIFLCIVIWSMATAACGLASTFWQLAAARLVVGFGEGGLSPAAYRILAGSFPARRLALAMGLFGAGTAIAGPFSLVVGGRLVDWATARGGAVLPLFGHVEDWQLVFLIMGPPGVLLAPLIFLVRDDKPAPAVLLESGAADMGAEIGLWSFLRSQWRYLLPICVGFGFVALMSYGVAAWTPTFLQRHYGLSMTQIGNGLALTTGISGALCFIGGGAIADWWFSRGVRDAHFRMFVVCLPAVVLAGWLGFAEATHPIASFACLALLWLLMPSSAPAVAHLQLSTPVHLRGRVVALFMAGFNIIGLTLGPLTVAMLTEWAFRDPASIGLSLGLTVVGSGGMAMLLFAASLRPARAAIAGQKPSGRETPIQTVAT